MSQPSTELGLPPALAEGTLRIVALGGLGEVGRNMAVLEYAGRLLVIDCGVLFPEDHQPGVDLILPDFDHIAGRLDDMPIGLSQPKHEFRKDPSGLSRFVPPYNGTPAGSFYADPSEHGGWVTPVTQAQRAEWGRQGADYIAAQVAAFDVNGALEALRQRDAFTRELEKKYGDLLPGARR